MDRRDWELLDRQMSRLRPTSPAHGLNALVLVGIVSRRYDGRRFPLCGRGTASATKDGSGFLLRVRKPNSLRSISRAHGTRLRSRPIRQFVVVGRKISHRRDDLRALPARHLLKVRAIPTWSYS
jgi:hypothetical protein